MAEVRGNVRYQPLLARQLFLKTGFQLREQRVNNFQKARRWSYAGTAPLPADPTIRLYDTEKTGRMMPQWESAAFMKDGVPYHSTACGKPAVTRNRSRTSLVEGVTPSCRRCQQLMTHWNRKPIA